MSRRLALVSLLGVTLIVLATAFGGDGDRYIVRLAMDNAGGLRDGSAVAIGGVNVGEVKLGFDERDRVVAEVEVDPEHAPVGRDARVSISAVNLLGQKRVDIEPGDAARAPAPSGTVIPQGRIQVSTDLDQVLSALTPETRTRLAVLLNEAGSAFVGRKAEFSRLVAELPPTLTDADALLRALVQDNRNLGRVVERSDRLLGEVTARRRSLSRAVDTLGETAETFAGRAPQLRATLSRAPHTLASVQRFLGELETTAAPLGGAARLLTATARPLTETLDALDPFERSTRPTLAAAIKVAPKLTRLADGATPVLRRAVPTAGSLATFSRELAPVSSVLDRSANNIIAVLDNWAKAIQFRDGASHVFRGQPSFTVDTVRSAVARFLASTTKRRRTSTRGPRRTERPATVTPRPQRPRLPAVPKVTEPLQESVERVLDSVTGLLGLGGSPSTPKGGSGGSSGASEPLLDFLLKP